MTSPSNESPNPSVLVVGVGLIGGSIALGLKEAGWHVVGYDTDEDVLDEAQRRNLIDSADLASDVDLVVIAVPSFKVVEVTEKFMASISSATTIFTDVAGVKSTISSHITDPRFLGGHPMAGSELHGIHGARSDMFVGANWVLTPDASTEPEAYGPIQLMIKDLGAHSVTLSPEDHDRMVALVSHLPHLVAASLMNQASESAADDDVLLQLAAGGFRDMTRIAAGDPAIWPDVVLENQEAILAGLDGLQSRLSTLRSTISSGERNALLTVLTSASISRNSLPSTKAKRETLTEMRIPVPDRPGVLAEITGVASGLDVSLFDLEIAHNIEGDRGVLILIVERSRSALFSTALSELGYVSSSMDLH